MYCVSFSCNLKLLIKIASFAVNFFVSELLNWYLYDIEQLLYFEHCNLFVFRKKNSTHWAYSLTFSYFMPVATINANFLLCMLCLLRVIK